MKRGIWASLREWALRLKGSGRTDADLERELLQHVELAEEELLRSGHSPEEAHRLARVQAGKQTQAMETLRDQRRLPALNSFWLDCKLGLRMLAKHWGLTLVGGVAMAVAIAAGATVFDVIQTLSGTHLPLKDGDRVVVVQPWDPATRREHYSSAEEFVRWREQLESVEHVAAFATVERNLITEDGQSAPVTVAEMSAAGFRVAASGALLGRFLLEEDERYDAAPVVVIGHRVWQSRFQGDPGVVGRRVQLGTESYTVAGVMPEGFVFPVAHDAWVPLRTSSPPGRQMLEAPPWGNSDGDGVLTVFARLAPDVSMERAQAEVRAKGLVIAGSPDGVRPLEARLVPYTVGITGNTDSWWIRQLLGFALVVLLIPPCANIAVLIYARIVARQREFAARLALGASRGRIVAQVFTEVLVLALGSAGLGLILAREAAAMFQASQEERLGRALPFWMNFDLSWTTVLYACALAVAAALIAGGIPALRATGRWAQTGLHALGNRTSLRLGKAWIAIVVLQVALSVAVLPAAVEAAWWTLQSGLPGTGFDPSRYLTARLVMDSEPGTEGGAAFAATRDELVRLLNEDAGVGGVAVSQSLPGSEQFIQVQWTGGTFPSGRVMEWVRFNRAGRAFFETYAMPLLAGRWLEPGDLVAGNNAILINRNLAEHLFGGSSPLGQRLRRVTIADDPAQTEEWQVAGIVDDSFDRRDAMTLYRPLPPVPDTPALSLTLRAAPSGTATAGMSRLAARLRAIAATLDPSLRVLQPRTLGAIYEDRRTEDYWNSSVIVGVVMGVLLFSVAGIYTILSFTVVQRRREIGIRAALGAPPAQLIAGIFRRAMLPVAIGVAVGSLAALWIEFYLSDILFASIQQSRHAWIMPAAEAFVFAIGLLAIAGPARRAMRVDPVEALRDG